MSTSSEASILSSTVQPEQSTMEQPVTSTSSTAEQKPAYVPTKPSLDQIMDPSYWREHYLPLTIYGFQPHYQRGDILTNTSSYNGDYRYVGAWLASNGLLPLYRKPDGQYEIAWDEYMYYIERFFGEEHAQEEVYKDEFLRDMINWERRTITLQIPGEYDPQTNTLDPYEFGWFMDEWKFTSITPFTENKMEKVKIEIERYESRDFSQLDRLETFVLFWDNEVGYVVESSSWKWAETHNVSFQGDITQIETLWDLPPERYKFPCLESLEYYSEFGTSGDTIYRFRIDGSKLLRDALHCRTGEQTTGELVYDFGDEIFMHYDYQEEFYRYYGEDDMVVYTNKAAYLFDKNRNLKMRKIWPKAVRSADSKGQNSHFTMNNDFSKVAFYSQAGEGLYICDMMEDATPVRMQESTPFRDGDFQSPFPIRFLGRTQLFVGVSMWERIGAFRIVDWQEQTVSEFPYASSGPHSGGSCMLNSSGVFFSPMGSEENYYYNFQTQELEQTDWLDTKPLGYTNACIPDPVHPYIWYMSIYNSENKRTVFAKLDFQKKNLTMLPFEVTGCQAALLTLSENGHMLFAYAYKGEQGFGMYQNLH